MDVLDLEGIDDDLELETELQVETMETDLDRPMSRLSVMPDTVGPNSNELRLGKRVLELEKERDALAAELARMKAKSTPPTSTTVSVPPAPSESEEKIEIPHALLPILDVMRHHISELTRDNQAMRYTFGLDSASSSNIKLDGHLPMEPRISDKQGVDLKAVVDRVRALVKENEELGDIVLEAGRVDTAEWERALEDSQKVITSLDADLQHLAETVQKLRQELETYKTQTPATATPRAGPSRDLLSPPPRSAGGSQDGRQRGGQRDDRRHDSRRGHGQGQGQGYRDDRSMTSSQRDRDRDRDRDRERNRAREKDKDVGKEKEGEKGKDKSGLSIRGASGGAEGGGSDFGPIPRREDDRATKRRK